MMPTIAEKLIEHWRRQGLSLNSGCDPQRVAEFERHNRVELPGAMRDYFRSADGMKETFNDSEDRNGFSFWPLPRVVRVPEVTNDVHIIPFEGDSNFFFFADYLHWSWAYAANFTKGSAGAVILIGRAVPEEIAASFEEFVELYISDSDRLYGGGGSR
jgi:hypothetical protein